VTIVDDEMSTIADVFEAAAELLELHGWSTGVYETPTGRMCALGALRRAAGWHHGDRVDVGGYDVPDYGGRIRRADTARLILEFHLNKGDANLITTEWNDHVAGSADVVIDTFKHVAKEIRNEICVAP
jgi:hypothetical protein